MKKRSVVFTMSLSLCAMHLGFSSLRMNDKNTLEEQAEAKLLASIEYVEENNDDVFDLGFNTYKYLPLEFDPYKGMIYALEDIEYIEWDQELEL